MNLYAHHPFWLMKDGLPSAYPSLAADITADVAIVGAGISGALAAWYLRNSGHSLVVVDRRHTGMGSTAASTSFLQYEIDEPLSRLCNKVGEENAVASYQLCRKAIYDLRSICEKLNHPVGFHLRESLQYASYKKHCDPLHEEYAMRRKHGFDVDWLDSSTLANTYSLHAPAAIRSADGGQVDAYALTHELLRVVQRRGHAIYNNTWVKEIDRTRSGVVLHTAQGNTIKAKKLIIACGYESQQYIPHRVADVYSTYAMVSEPVDPALIWHRNCLVWETASPYLYFRVTEGNRILIGGKDDKFHNPGVRNARIRRKTDMLLHSFAQRMPHIPLRPDFCWAGAFAVTKDGLPYIGAIPGIAHTYFALGYGGNGITFSLIAAQIIHDMITGKKNTSANLFTFNR